MVAKKKDIQFLKSYIATTANKKFKKEMLQVIELFKDRKISTLQTSRKLIDGLASRNKKTNENALTRLSNYKDKPKTIKTERYLITGKAKLTIVYKSRQKKGQLYSKKFHNDIPREHTIIATSKTEAEQKFIQIVMTELERSTENYDESVEQVEDVFIKSITLLSSIKTNSEMDALMRRSTPIQYEYIPHNLSMLKSDNMCVIDQLVELYSKKLKLFRRENLIEEITRIENSYSKEHRIENWTIEQGVRARTINQILKNCDISYYSFDAIKQCFDKYISKNRNFKSLIYFSVNEHMYIITNEKAKSLVEKAKDNRINISSTMIEQQNDEKQENDNRVVYENIPVQDLLQDQYKNSLIIYNNKVRLLHNDETEEYFNKTNINDVLADVIKIHGYIPDSNNIIHGNNSGITKIKFNMNDQNIILSIDPNYTTNGKINYDNIKSIIDIHNNINNNRIEFTNQSIGGLSLELRKNFFETDSTRIKFTKAKREELLIKFNRQCNICNCKIEKKFHIDHIKPLASGGNNNDENLQVLCIECHHEKTKQENEEHSYLRISETGSSFNNQVYDIINSNLAKVYSFVETRKTTTDKNKQIFKMDINKSRKNSIYFSNHDFPLFTIMDDVEKFIPFKSSYDVPGLYYIESDNTFPLRKNGWYSVALTNFCINNNIINQSNIKYVVYASLTIPKNYFNSFIDYVYKNFGNYAKIIINSMIGIFAINNKDKYRTLAITSDRNVAFHHSLRRKSGMVEKLDIESDETYYHVFEQYQTQVEELELPIYNQVLEQEIINLYELAKLIESKNGSILDLNTDAVVFEASEFPFKVNDDNNISGYYFDAERKVHKYKLEENNARIKCPKKAGYVRSEIFELKSYSWNVLHDPEDNNFDDLVKTILDTDKSFNITGPAGSGKSTLIKKLVKELEARNNNFKSLAPTNRACRVIDGSTIHRFIASFNINSFRKNKFKYLFIDECSMIPEIFYKFFIFLKRAVPEIKIILAGDWRQLGPVNDRLGNKCYQDSRALYELCDGHQLILTKCRRSSDVLFNMLKEENINKINSNTFGKKFCRLHLSFTNKTRMRINKIMMDYEVKTKKKKPLELKKLPYDKNSQDVKLIASMPIISRVNFKSLGICNNDCFTISEIRKDKIIIADDNNEFIEIPVEKFQYLFNPAYCITVHKSQGQTYNHEYTIHEFSKYDDKLKYVSLSRATDINNINISDLYS